MRNTKKSNSVVGTDIAQELETKKIKKFNEDFILLFDYSYVEQQIKTITLSWVGSSLIECMKTQDRENTLYFIFELQDFLKTIFHNKEITEYNYLELYCDFFDKWSNKECYTTLQNLSEAFINSENANDNIVRSNAYMFLCETTTLLNSVNKSIKKINAITT